jgi:hypothetical protein
MEGMRIALTKDLTRSVKAAARLYGDEKVFSPI